MKKSLLWFGLLPFAPAFAQEAPLPPAPAPDAIAVTPSAPEETPLAEDEVGFSARELNYDENAEVVTARGDVRMIRNGYRLRADTVTWNRKTGGVEASGNVVTTSPEGDTAYGDRVQLDDTLKDGVVENLLLVLADGGRLAANRGTRKDGVTTLDHAAYTPCPVIDDDGCPKEPLWRITAVKVVHNPDKHRIYYRGASLHLLGARVPLLPNFSHPDGSASGGTGLLMPDARYSRVNGLEFALPYYFALAPNRDLTLTPHIYSKVAPGLEGQFRALTSNGAFEVEGMITYSDRQAAVVDGDMGPSDKQMRGYIDADGRFQFGPYWTISSSLRLATDKTFLRRYDISRDDRLRSTVNVERIDASSYLSIAGWYFQGLRSTDKGGTMPFALPAIDYRLRLDDPIAGGKVELEANSLAIVRTEGQDTQRAFASARWDLRRITSLGQELTLTGYARADIYHANDVGASVPTYSGLEGWHGRGIAAVAADLRWPFVGEFLGGTQRLVPHVQVVASPPTRNLAIPNEDARAIDLDDSNLFALNRYPGYDRWEDGTRITYGGEYALDMPRFSVRAVIGQSYRFSDKISIYPPGTGLSDKFSDIVGRATLKFGRWVSYTQRFRLDKDNFAIRRNEADVTVGSDATYLTAGYLRLNRDISTLGEDLTDREEVRLGARMALLKRWSVFGSTVIDLTGKQEDPLSIADGFSPIRHRLGFAYEDECFSFGITWRRDYSQTGDARRGNSFVLRLSLKNLGR